MAHSPAFQFYPKDFLADPNTVRMDATDVGVYMFLLMECWNRDNKLPKDVEVLAAFCRMTVQEFTPIWENKVRRCFQEMKTFFWHKRLKKEISKQIEWREKKSKSGKLGADKRWHGNELQDSGAMALPSSDIAPDSSSLVLSGLVSSENNSTTAVERKPKLSDEEWLESLITNPAYKNIAVRIEYARAQVWATTNNRQCTRRFFVNWLNRAKPMEVRSNGSTSGRNPVGPEETIDACGDFGARPKHVM